MKNFSPSKSLAAFKEGNASVATALGLDRGALACYEMYLSQIAKCICFKL